jgi:hypothetical protein
MVVIIDLLVSAVLLYVGAACGYADTVIADQQAGHAFERYRTQD